VDVDTTIAEMTGYQLCRHRIIIEKICLHVRKEGGNRWKIELG
jgi:hypothetical protein